MNFISGNIGVRVKNGYLQSLLLLFFLLIPSFIFAQDNYDIRKIKFSGNKTFSDSDLLDNMSFKRSNIINRWIQREDPSLYSSEMMELDLERLTRFYQSKGFLEVNVEMKGLEQNDKKKTVNLRIQIQENTPVKVDSIDITITDSIQNERYSRFDRYMLRSLELKKGERFTDQQLYSDVTKLNTIFSNLGYVYSNTQFSLDLRPDEHLTNIYYSITPGNLNQFGETSVLGNKYVKEKYIRRQIEYKEDQRYNQELLDKTRQQLYNLQLFRIVSISPQTDRATQRNPIPVRIQIEEIPRWMTKFGVGWGTEDKFRAFADVTYRGLFGGTSRLNVYAKHSALTPYYVSLSWIEPQFFLKKLSASVNPYIKWEKEPGYDTQTLGISVPFTYRFTDKMQASLSYYFEGVKQNVESDDAEIPNPESDQFLYNKSGLSASFSYSTARPVMSPVKGWSVTVGGKLNGYIFGGDFDYTKAWIDARKYQQLIGGIIFAGRVMIGGIHSSNASNFIPVEDRFYSGGSNSNRGWARSELGPKRESGTPLGGKSILEMNVEFRRRLFWEVDLAVFMDAGNVWTDSYSYDFKKLAYAAGGGIRVNTPIGPVRLDVGVPLWNEKRSVQFFLSIGQAF